jgi:hypothetical protein
LVDDAIRKEHLLLVTADLQNDGTREGFEKPREQGRFTGPRLTLEVDDLRSARLCGRESPSKNLQFVFSPDKSASGHG